MFIVLFFISITETFINGPPFPRYLDAVDQISIFTLK